MESMSRSLYIFIHKAKFISEGAIDLMCEQFNKVCETTDCDSEKYKYVQEISMSVNSFFKFFFKLNRYC